MKRITRKHLKLISIVLGIILCAEVSAFAFRIKNDYTSYSKNLDLGNKYLLEMDYDSAVTAFSRAIKIDEMTPDAYIGRGDAYIALGDYAKAWADYEKAEELSGRHDILSGKFPERSIHVSDDEGTPVSDADIVLTGSSHSYTLRTDNNGDAADTVFPDTYAMTVSKTDYQEETQTIDISYSSSAEVGVSVTLIPVTPRITPDDIELVELSENTENTVSVDGLNTDTISFRSYSVNHESAEVSGNVNGISFSFVSSISFSRVYSAFATDLNVNDDYRNIILCIYGIDDESEVNVLCYNSERVERVGGIIGSLDPDSSWGDGTFYTFTNSYEGDRSYGIIVSRFEQHIDGLNLTEGENKSGYFSDVYNQRGFNVGYPLVLIGSLPLYSDAGCSQPIGSIPAGTPASITSSMRGPYGYISGVTYYVESSAGNGWVNHDGLRSALNNYFAAG